MKIVSLSSSLTEILSALGAEDCLAGASDLCEPATQELPRIGSPKSVRFDLIDSLAPDWVLADSQDNRPEEIVRLRERHKVRLFEVKGPEGVCDALAELGRLVGKREEAKKLIGEIEVQIRQNREAFGGRPQSSR